MLNHLLFRLTAWSTLVIFPVVGWGAQPAHRLLLADSSKQRVAIVDEAGAIEWEMKIGPLHDLHLLDNGHVLLQTAWTRVVEIDPKTNRVVWEYDATKQPEHAGRKIEIHAFQRLANGNTMVVESGAARILELAPDGKKVVEIPLQVNKPHPHRDTRLVRKLASGNYLVCHEGDGRVCEYSPKGSVVWEYAVPLFDREPANGHGVEGYGNQCFSALRLPNGNTLISTGNGHRVLEVSPDKQITWQVTASDLPGIELAWITTLQRLPSGNLILGNCHAGESNPQLIEIDQNKKVVWQFKDFERFGNSLTNSQILSTDGEPVISLPGRDR